MATGHGKRFGNNKLMADFLGKPLIQWALDATYNIFSHRIVVTRHTEIRDLCIYQNVPVILHNLPNRNDTIRLGLSKLKNDINLCAFLPADQPLINQITLKSMLDAAMESPDYIYRAAYKDTSASPVIFPEKYFDELLALSAGQGGNIVIKNHLDCIKNYSVSFPYELQDIDTKEDLDNLILTYTNSINK